MQTGLGRRLLDQVRLDGGDVATCESDVCGALPTKALSICFSFAVLHRGTVVQWYLLPSYCILFFFSGKKNAMPDFHQAPCGVLGRANELFRLCGFAPFLYTCAWVGRIQLFFAPDTDTVELLKRAMRTFRGGFAVVSHNEKLIEEAGKSLHSVCMLPYIMLPFGFDLCLFGSFWEQEATRNKGHRY